MNLSDLILMGTGPCDSPLYGYGHLNEGPLMRMLRGQPAVPSTHYNASAPGIAGLLGTVDPRLIEDAMAEKAAGVTLH